MIQWVITYHFWRNLREQTHSLGTEKKGKIIIVQSELHGLSILTWLWIFTCFWWINKQYVYFRALICKLLQWMVYINTRYCILTTLIPRRTTELFCNDRAITDNFKPLYYAQLYNRSWPTNYQTALNPFITNKWSNTCTGLNHFITNKLQNPPATRRSKSFHNQQIIGPACYA